MKRYVLVGAALGLGVPLACWAGYELSGHRYLFGPETVLVWPSAILLFYTDGREQTPTGMFYAALSVVLNVMLYMAIGVVAFGASRVMRALRGRA